MLRRAGQWQGNRSPDNQTANKLVDAGGSWFEDVGSTPTASIITNLQLYMYYNTYFNLKTNFKILPSF